jgi:hypothetical protein
LSFVIPPSGVNYIKIFSSKTTRQFQPKFAWIILKYVSTGTLKVQCISDNPTNHPTWLLVLYIDNRHLQS